MRFLLSLKIIKKYKFWKTNFIKKKTKIFNLEKYKAIVKKKKTP